MKHNTNLEAAAKAGAKGNFQNLTASQCETIAAGLLRKYGSRQGTKAHGAELIAKYGKENYKAIDRAIQNMRAGAIEAAANMARAGVRAWEPAAREAMAAARKGGQFAKLATWAGEKWPTAAAFIAACYPNVIDGAPASLCYYVTGPEANTIVSAYMPAAIDGRNARAIIDTCLGKLAGALKKANKGGKGFKSPAQVREAAKIVAAYNVKPGAVLGTITRGEAVSPEALAQYAKGNTAGLVTLAAHNAEARKAYQIAAAADMLAAANGEAVSPEAAAILAREPRHKWLSIAAPVSPAKAKAPKGGKAKAKAAPKAPKAPKVSPEAAKAAREAMAQVDATIEAGKIAAKELAAAEA